MNNKKKTPFWKSSSFWETVALTLLHAILVGAAEGAKAYFQKREKEKHLKQS